MFAHTQCSRIRSKSFDLRWIIVKEKESDSYSSGEVLAEGKEVLVCYDYVLQKAIEIPEEQRRKMKVFEEAV